ncbi:MAG: hypothetical protein NUV84_05445 [Candidatus Uhrbacteria bacterium]|nr:hypothetical protein [Candidatus Uhrbacteria bacterium]
MFVIGLILLAVFTIILGSWILLLKRRSQAGISGWVKDSDLKGEGKKYIDRATGIVAKPDVVLRGTVIEVKSYPALNGPFKGDILQAAAEMNAVGAGKAEIHYPNQRFLVKNTTHLRDSLMHVYQAMKEHLNMKIAPHGTPTRGKCGVCEFKAVCPERL